MSFVFSILITLFVVGCAEHQHDESCGSHGGLHVHEPYWGSRALGEHGSGYNLNCSLMKITFLFIYSMPMENFVRTIRNPCRLIFLTKTNHHNPACGGRSATGNRQHLPLSIQRKGGFLPIKGVIQMIEIGSKQYSESSFSFQTIRKLMRASKTA